MSLILAIQNVSGLTSLPSEAQFKTWADHALEEHNNTVEVTLRIVDETEGRRLNKAWRNQDSATNVLSFPINGSIEKAPCLLGDIVICAPVIEREAKEQGKEREAHWAHLLIHGILHLQGYDHESEQDANIMETREIEILNDIGYSNPYARDICLRQADPDNAWS